MTTILTACGPKIMGGEDRDFGSSLSSFTNPKADSTWRPIAARRAFRDAGSAAIRSVSRGELIFTHYVLNDPD